MCTCCGNTSSRLKKVLFRPTPWTIQKPVRAVFTAKLLRKAYFQVHSLVPFYHWLHIKWNYILEGPDHRWLNSLPSIRHAHVVLTCTIQSIINVKFTLSKAVRSQTGVVVQLHSFFNLGARWRYMVNATPGPLYPRERHLVTIAQNVGWAPGLVWMSGENLSPPRDAITGPSSP
jgi:hypothetical protein